uniref:C-type lectin domain-containing protein n=1 Tax=Scleropages formosus TaxID=113540 RepID=A0A8C9WN40_SCLFO
KLKSTVLVLLAPALGTGSQGSRTTGMTMKTAVRRRGRAMASGMTSHAIHGAVTSASDSTVSSPHHYESAESPQDCYKLEADTRKSWVSARLDCLREGADLVSILSAEEEQYVISRLDSSQYDLWTGYSTLVMVLLRCSEHNPTKRFLKSWKKRTAIIWRSHVCRYERPYMCKRGLNSK